MSSPRAAGEASASRQDLLGADPHVCHDASTLARADGHLALEGAAR